MTWKQLVGAGTACALALSTAGCREEPPPPEPVVRPIKMLAIGGDEGGTREYPGRIRAAQQADMGFEVAGRIIEFVFREGTRVEEDGVLARLDPRDYQNDLEQSQARERQASTYLDRIRLAFKTRAVSEQDLTNAEAQLEVAQAEVKIKRKALADTQLRAPFDGIMSRKLVQDYANVQAKEPVLVFEDDSLLEIKVAVPERDLAGRRPTDQSSDVMTERIKPEVVVSAIPGKRFPARVKELATTADPTTRTFEATFRFDQPGDVVVLPGMTAKVSIRMDAMGESEFLIPAQAAVADAQGQASVWVFDEETSTVQPRPVELGHLTGNDVLVTSGLSFGDVVAISGVSQLRPGMQVRRWEP